MKTLPPCYLYLARQGWHETMETSQFIRGHCPIHDDHTPSFDIYFHDGHFYCNGCKEHGDIVKLVFLVEKLADWPTAYKRVEEIDAGWLPPREPRFTRPVVVTHTLATAEQRETMWLAAQYWHERLLSPEGEDARTYLLQRGVHRSTIEQCWQIGYAPPIRFSRQMDFFSAWLKNALGKRWRQRAIDVGLLTSKGTVRLQNRLVCSCAPPGRAEDVGFYQARILNSPARSPDDQQYTPAKFLNPPQIQKLPFTLPIAEPTIPGTVVVESFFGPLVLHQHGMPTLAALGNGTSYLTLAMLRAFDAPFYLCQDNDLVHYRGTKPYKAGDEQAESFAAICAQGGWPSPRIIPERIDDQRKGTDEWVCFRGPGPLQREIMRVQAELAAA